MRGESRKGTAMKALRRISIAYILCDRERVAREGIQREAVIFLKCTRKMFSAAFWKDISGQGFICQNQECRAIVI